jgi:hypothetical protein
MGLLAALLLAATLSTASARNLSLNEQGILVSWFSLEFQNVNATVRCPVTLDGSFHSRTIPKIGNLLIGAITEVRIKSASCTNGSASINNATLPWHILYRGFNGSLPALRAVLLEIGRFRFTATALGIPCTYGNATDTITYSGAVSASGEITELTPVSGNNIANIVEGRNPGELFGCSRTGVLVSGPGDGRVAQLNHWRESVIIRLI